MFRLSAQENLGGVKEGDALRPTYRVNGSAPRHIARSAVLLSDYDNRPERGFATNADESVAITRMAAFTILLVAVMSIYVLIVSPESKTGVVVMALISLVVVFAGNLISGLLCSEPMIDFLASRFFGTPVRPRLYVQRGVERGMVLKTHFPPADTEDAPENAAY